MSYFERFVVNLAFIAVVSAAMVGGMYLTAWIIETYRGVGFVGLLMAMGVAVAALAALRRAGD